MASSKQSKPKAKANPDAVDLLMEDHARVNKLFKAFEKAKEKEDDATIDDIVTTACTELKVHSQIEKEIFYPAIKAKATGELEDLLAEAEVEHEAVDTLVEKLSSVKLDDLNYQANFTVLSEFVQHHVKEEEKEMFPLVRKMKGIDLQALATEMSARKEELMGELVQDSGAMEGDSMAKPLPGSNKPKAKSGSRAAR